MKNDKWYPNRFSVDIAERIFQKFGNSVQLTAGVVFVVLVSVKM